MGKKRAREADGKQPENADKMDADDSSDDEDFDIVNVDFEWFNFDAEIDFHGTKSLLRQLLDVDATQLDMSALADVVLSQPTIGSTVKVDGKATDAYAMLTCLNLHEHRSNPAVAALTRYLADRAGSTEALAPVARLLGPSSAGDSDSAAKGVGLVLSERLINVPSEIAPPMYGMLRDELAAAVEDGEPYSFTHYLVLSKVYNEIESALPSDDAVQRKKKVRAAAAADRPTYYFHPEDEVLQRHAAAHGSFAHTAEETVADSKRAFHEMGVHTKGAMVLIEAAKFEAAVAAVGEYLGQSA